MGRLNIRDIVIGQKKFTLPFELVLSADSCILQCNKLLRFVPGRRAVLSGVWDKKKIIIKFFFKPLRYKNHVKKELRGNDLLKEAKIPTNKILYSRFCNELKSHILIFEFIDSSTSLKEVFEFERDIEPNDLRVRVTQNLNDTHKKHLISLIKLIAEMHEKGIIQNDLHLDNFLLKKNIIYALDGASIKLISTRPLEQEISLKNLAILLSQINIQSNHLLHELVHAYAVERQLKQTDLLFYELEKYIKKSHDARVARYLKKIYRRSTEMVCKKLFSSFVICRRKYYTPAMETFLQNPDIAFHNPGTSLLKAGNTATLVRYQIDGIELVVKRYNMKNIFHAFRLAFKTSRADKSWRNAHLLMKNGINTPKPVAIKERRFGPFRNKAFFICEYIEGESMSKYFLDVSANGAKNTAESIIGVFKKFKSLKISHGDMKATNIIIQDNTPYFIDLDSMSWHKSKFLFSYAWKKDIKRFMKNWKNNFQILELFKELQD